MRNPIASAMRCGALLLPAALLVVSLAGTLHAQDESATLANANSAADPSPGAAPAPAEATPEGGVTTADESSSPGSVTAPADATVPDNNSSPDSAGFDTTYSEPFGGGVEGLERARSLPPDAFGEQPAGIPYSSVFNQSGIDLNDASTFYGATPFRSELNQPAQVAGAEGNISVSQVDVRSYLPFLLAGAEPDNADIKAGPFYVKFHSLSGLVLYDDNYLRNENNRRSDLLVLLSLNLSIIAQLSESLQFTVTGSIAYLPTQNQVGLIVTPYLGPLLYLAPYFVSRLAYDTVIAGWPVVFTEDFRAGVGQYSTSAADDFDLFRGDSLQREEDGRYTFRYPATNRQSGEITSEDNGVGYYSNFISAATQREIPGDVLMTAGISHENIWYNQGGRGLPPERDDLYASLLSQRVNMRFKPYASYDASYIGDSPGITQIIRGGIVGPIDDQVSLNVSAGAFFDASHHDGYLYEALLNHTAGPYTQEQISASRSLTSFNQEQATSEYYRITQVLGPTLSSNLFLDHTSYEELASGGTGSHSDSLGGLEFIWDLGPKTSFTAAGIYDHGQYGGGERIDTTTGRAILNRIITEGPDGLTFQLLYEYQHANSNRHGDSYLENFVYVQIVKYL